MTKPKNYSARLDAYIWFLVVMLLGMALMAAGYPAYATDKPTTPNQSQAQTQDQHQANAQTVTAGGGSGGGASNYLSEESLGLAFGTTAPIPLEGYPSCYVPGKGFKRGHSVLFGLWAASAVAVKDEQCQADLDAQRAHEARMAELALETIKAKGEADKAASERIRAEACLSCAVAK